MLPLSNFSYSPSPLSARHVSSLTGFVCNYAHVCVSASHQIGNNTNLNLPPTQSGAKHLLWQLLCLAVISPRCYHHFYDRLCYGNTLLSTCGQFVNTYFALPPLEEFSLQPSLYVPWWWTTPDLNWLLITLSLVRFRTGITEIFVMESVQHHQPFSSRGCVLPAACWRLVPRACVCVSSLLLSMKQKLSSLRYTCTAKCHCFPSFLLIMWQVTSRPVACTRKNIRRTITPTVLILYTRKVNDKILRNKFSLVGSFPPKGL